MIYVSFSILIYSLICKMNYKCTKGVSGITIPTLKSVSRKRECLRTSRQKEYELRK